MTSETKKRRIPWRKWLRALHRDIGYLAVGLTLVYTLSGLAVNHIDDWDPNFQAIDHEHELTVARPSFDPEDAASVNGVAIQVLASIGVNEEPDDVYAVDESHIDITLEHSTLYVDWENNTLRQEGQKPRPIMRVINWLHLNRGKKAWTYVADTYAILLLYLAVSGLFMLAGKKGLIGRGGILVTAGVAVPILYVVLSGGP